MIAKKEITTESLPCHQHNIQHCVNCKKYILQVKIQSQGQIQEFLIGRVQTSIWKHRNHFLLGLDKLRIISRLLNRFQHIQHSYVHHAVFPLERQQLCTHAYGDEQCTKQLVITNIKWTIKFKCIVLSFLGSNWSNLPLVVPFING